MRCAPNQYRWVFVDASVLSVKENITIAEIVRGIDILVVLSAVTLPIIGASIPAIHCTRLLNPI